MHAGAVSVWHRGTRERPTAPAPTDVRPSRVTSFPEECCVTPGSRRRSLLAIAGSVALSAGLLAPAAADETADPAAAPGLPAQFTLDGAGFGHGVGMSQWGAYGMAKAGFDAASIVTHYYTGTQVVPAQDDMDIRVALLYQTKRVSIRSEALDPTGGAIEVTVGSNLVVGSPLDTFTFKVRDGQVWATREAGGQTTDLGVAPTATVRWAGTRTPGGAAGGPTLANVTRNASSLDTPGHRYRFGVIDVVPVSTRKGVELNVVNSVRIHDEYLYGISEVSSSWPEAAMQAQAMASRTYALSKVDSGVRQSCSCHVDDGGGPYADQTFTGWTKASAAMGDRWVAAVDATKTSDTTGNAILYNGKAIRAFYSASSGGATQDVRDVWGGELPYVVSVPDPWMKNPDNPNASWQVVVPQARMAALFGAPGISSVDVIERDRSGAVKTVRATLPDGRTATLSGPRFAGGLGLKSRYINLIDGRMGPPVPSSDVAAVPAPAPQVPAAAPDQAPPAAPSVAQRTVSLLTPADITVRKGKRYKVVGIVRPAQAKLKVWRQKLVDGEWRTVAKERTNAKGRYRFVVRDAGKKSTGTFRVLVVKKKDVVGVSPEFAVRLR